MNAFLELNNLDDQFNLDQLRSWQIYDSHKAVVFWHFILAVCMSVSIAKVPYNVVFP